MKKYSVKEVRDITGLTRKQLYDFKEGIPGIGPKNEAGYKQYRKEDVKKFIQAALFTKLGAKPKKINEMFKEENYDSKEVLKELRNDAEKKRKEAEDIITVVEAFEYASNDMFMELNPYICKDIHIFAEHIRSLGKDEEIKAIVKFIYVDGGKKIFMEIGKLKDLKEDDIGKRKSYVLVENFKKNVEQEIKIYGNRFLTIVANGLVFFEEFRKKVENVFGKGKADIIANAIWDYEFEGVFEDMEDDLDCLIDCWDREYDDDVLKQCIIRIKTLLMKCMGLSTTYEFITNIEGVRYFLRMEEDLSEKRYDFWDKIISFIVKGVKYYEG